MDSTAELPTVLSLCTGYGGIERGLELAGFEHRVLAYVEIEAFAIANLVAKMEQGELVPAPIYTDLKTFPSDLFRDSVDIITGGYPCQPFSVAGKATTTKESFSDPRHLFPYILDHVRTIRPAQCFFENVEGHINRGLESVLQDLEGAGYDSTWGIFSAEEVGAPHQRKRIFILANSDSSRQLQSQGSESEKRGWTGDSGQEGSMANTDSDDRRDRSRTLARDRRTRLEHRSGSERQSIGQPKEELANTINEGSCSSAHRQQGSDIWNFEPSICRVADGVANRVDRLRLLGNGVVPQTAAKAWIVLNEQIEEEE